MRAVLIGVLTSLALLWTAPVCAQQVDITVPAPERAQEPVIIPPGDYQQVTRPSDADYYPQPPKVRHDPAFFGPLSSGIQTPTSTGRVGVAGWTAPNTPVGANQTGWRDVNGWFALGFVIEWGGPPPTKQAPR